jgi:hypothetical protein
MLNSSQAAIEACEPRRGRNAGSLFPRLRGKREGEIEMPRKGIELVNQSPVAGSRRRGTRWASAKRPI